MSVGIKCSFLSEDGAVESWVWQGGNWDYTNTWSTFDGGSNLIIKWLGDTKKTREQVSIKDRMPGVKISYLSPDGWVNEQYIGNTTSSADWNNDENWIDEVKEINSILFNTKTQKVQSISSGVSVSMKIDGKWAKGTIARISVKSDDAVINEKSINIGITGKNNILALSVNSPDYIFLDEDNKVFVLYINAKDIITGGSLTLVVETIGMKDISFDNSKSLSELRTKIQGNVSKSTQPVSAKNSRSIEVNGNWKAGVTVDVYISSNVEQNIVMNLAVVYKSGTQANILRVGDALNKKVRVHLTDDCSKIFCYVPSFTNTGYATLNVIEDGALDTIDRYDSYIFGSNIIDYRSSKIGKFSAKIIGYWRANTKLRLKFFGTAQFSSASFSIGYVTYIKENAFSGRLGEDIYITLKEDCEFISYSIDNVTIQGDIKIEITSSPQVLNNPVVGGQITILGDSYSAYHKWIKDGYLTWYARNGTDGENQEQNDVSCVEDMWWYKLCRDLNCTLLKNDSYSGSPICNVGYSHADASDQSFIFRMTESLGEKNVFLPKPNLIIILGGTNDTWIGTELGALKYEGWSGDDFKKVLPSICYMFYYIKKWNPGSVVINVVNDIISQSIKDGFKAAADHYGGIYNLELKNISKQGNHPDRAGMISISEQIYSMIISSVSV